LIAKELPSWMTMRRNSEKAPPCATPSTRITSVSKSPRAVSEEGLGTYTFNKHVIKHRFCQMCGIHPYGEGVDPKGNRMAAINIRCLENVDLASVPVQNFDGRSM
jgi:hypothetical protein